MIHNNKSKIITIYIDHNVIIMNVRNTTSYINIDKISVFVQYY